MKLEINDLKKFSDYKDKYTFYLEVSKYGDLFRQTYFLDMESLIDLENQLMSLANQIQLFRQEQE
jgi:hypothetical protein